MAFNIPSQWGAGKANPSTAPLTWARASDWPVITDTANEVQLLVSDAALLVYAIKTTFTRPASENLYIDWGDGTVSTVTTDTSTFTTHTYVAGTGTACSRGYTTWKVRVYTDAGCVITQAQINGNSGVSMPYVSNLVINATGLLEIYYGDGTQPSDFSTATSNIACYYTYLEYVKFPSDMSYNTVSGFFNNSFNNTTTSTAAAANLSKVVMPTTMGTTTNIQFSNTFNSCYNLLEFTFPATIVCTNLDSTFTNCKNLQTVTFPTYSTAFSTLTAMNTTFSGCTLLTTLVNMPASLPAITSLASTFASCTSLNNITIPRLGTTAGGSISLSSAFSTCSSLRSIIWAGDYTGGTAVVLDMPTTFSSCINLSSFRMPEGPNIASMNSTFQICSMLKSVILPNSAVGINNLTSCFASCAGLQEVVFPVTVTSSVSLASTFSACSSIQNVQLFEGGTITSLSATFTNCISLKSITLPASLANCTTLSQTFNNCTSLQSATLPASMPLVTTCASLFSSCTSLQTVTLPTTLTLVTTIAFIFNGCTSLTSGATFPALPAATTAQSAFINCRSLTSVVFSSINASFTTWTSAFSGCTSLVTVTLPSTQMTGVTVSATGLGQLFQSCSRLETVNNMDKIGSTATATLFDASTTTNNTFTGIYQLQSISLSPRLSRFTCFGYVNNSTINKVAAVRLLATGGTQWTGSSPQISIAYTSMGTAAIVTMFNDMAAQASVVSKTVDITGAVGASGLTAADRLIVTSKGWTITG